eukprot:g33719.t1
MDDNHDVQGFFCAVKTTYGPNLQGSTPLLAKDEAIRHHWGVHFRDDLDQGCVVDPSVLDRIPQHATRSNPAPHEVEKAICQLKNNRAVGADAIPVEALKHRGKELFLELHVLVWLIWKEESNPGELQDVTVLSVFKKGNKSYCGNYS